MENNSGQLLYIDSAYISSIENIFFVSHPISHRRTMSRKVCFVAVFAVFALLQVCLLLCLRITSMLELIFSQIPPHTYKVLRYGPLLCTKILHKKIRPFCFKMLTHISGPEPVPYMCVFSLNYRWRKKRTGLDEIPSKLIKIATDVVAPSLTYNFKQSLLTGIPPPPPPPALSPPIGSWLKYCLSFRMGQSLN